MIIPIEWILGIIAIFFLIITLIFFLVSWISDNIVKKIEEKMIIALSKYIKKYGVLEEENEFNGIKKKNKQ